MEDNNKLDLMSDLPCEILRHIISFLPLKEAVRSTSVLSTTWRQLLAPLSVNLEPNTKGIANIQQVLGRFLRSYVSHERLKLISFRAAGDDDGEDLKDDVGLIAMATKGVEKELHLHFMENSRKSRTIDHGFHLKMQQTLVLGNVQSFSSLKTLHLRSVDHHATRLVSDLFACCRRLESLTLEKCGGLEDLHVEGCNSLQSLTILDCGDIVSITICARNLKSFSYRGVLPRMQLQSASDLVEANLDFRYGVGGNEFDLEEVLCLLDSLKEVQILTLCGWLLEWMCTAGVIFGRLEFQFNKLKKLCWFSSSMDRAKRDSLACFLNMCPLLEKLLVQMDQSFSSFPCPFFHQHWHEPHLWMDYEMVKSNTSQLKHLKIFELSGFSSDDSELLLMELLLNKAVVLESMIVT
ncbi:F-box protein At2g39490 [Morus notabilis]|uniref:F-box protein At2g39490 n=1 Tax=Morus notabilis TaxID=981085 RepID=UPI000CECF30D|nr:F-box protein At2g39490 [Morus notabilis]XP_024022002.1 F-box protein At2g39490 [Morus notabilis]